MPHHTQASDQLAGPSTRRAPRHGVGERAGERAPHSHSAPQRTIRPRTAGARASTQSAPCPRETHVRAPRGWHRRGGEQRWGAISSARRCCRARRRLRERHQGPGRAAAELTAPPTCSTSTTGGGTARSQMLVRPIVGPSESVQMSDSPFAALLECAVYVRCGRMSSVYVAFGGARSISIGYPTIGYPVDIHGCERFFSVHRRPPGMFLFIIKDVLSHRKMLLWGLDGFLREIHPGAEHNFRQHF